MANIKGGLVQKAVNGNEVVTPKKASLAETMNNLLDQNGIKTRINELLGSRAPQFVGSLVSLVNADASLQQAFQQAPMTVIQAGLRAATYDLPIDPQLGFSYIVPFKDNSKGGIMTANFIMGYKGMYQLALRTGVYTKLNVVDVREGELVKFNRLTEDIEFNFIDDFEKRNKAKIIGYCGMFRLVNGMEKVIYMTVEEIQAHELKNRKGKYMGKGWRDDFESMCSKTVLRRLIGKWGIMSIDYKTATPDVVKAAEAIMLDEQESDPKAIEVETVETINNDDETDQPSVMSEEDLKALEEGMDR